MQLWTIRLSRVGYLLVLGLGVLGSCASTPVKPLTISRGDYEAVKHYGRALARHEMKSHHVTGLSLALVDDQQVVWAEGFGYADEARKLPSTPDTVYRVGSISKLLTATAAMQLAEQGKLALDQPVQAYVPEFAMKTRFANSSPITPRALMSHHAGLPSDFLKGMWSTNPAPFSSVLSALQHEYVAYPPNTVWAYSNLGMAVLGHAIERLSGEAYQAYMTRALLQPLGMGRSAFSARADAPGLSKAYRQGKENAEMPLRDVPVGGLSTTVLDLSRFMRMVFAAGKVETRQVLKPETLAEMLRPQNSEVPLDQGFRVGLGWMLSGLGDIDIQGAGPVAHHSGATLLFRSQLIVLPAQKLGVVVLANSSSAQRAVNTIATETLKVALEAKTGIKQPEPRDPADDAHGFPPATLQALAGHYATTLGLVQVSNNGGDLRARALDRTFRLVPRQDGLLRLQYKLLGLIPIGLRQLDHIGLTHTTVAGRELLVARSGSQALLLGEKIAPVPVPAAWQRRAGAYEVTNAGADMVLFENMRLRYKDGFLMVDYALPLFSEHTLNLALQPLSDTEAVIFGLGRNMGDTIRVVASQGQEYLQYSGYLLQKKED